MYQNTNCVQGWYHIILLDWQRLICMALFGIVWIGEVVLDQCIPYSSKKLSVNNRIVKVDFCLVYLFMYGNINGHSMNTNTKKKWSNILQHHRLLIRLIYILGFHLYTYYIISCQIGLLNSRGWSVCFDSSCVKRTVFVVVQ